MPLPPSTSSARAVRSDAHDAAPPSIRCGHVEISFAVKGQSLRPAQPAEEAADLALLIDAEDAVKTGSGRPGDEKFAGRAECQVVGGDGRLERSEDENLAVRADLENRAAAISDEKIADGVKRNARSDAHAFHPKLRTPVGGDAMNGSIVAAGNVQVALAVQSQPGGIHQFGDEGFYFVVRRDFIERDRHFLPAMAAVGDVNVAFDVHRGIGHGMKIVGNLHAEVKGHGLAGGARGLHAHDAAGCAVRHARDQVILCGDQNARFGFAETHVRA